MNDGGKRQLPSWMVRTANTEQASNTETRVKNKENDSAKLDTKIVGPLKEKVQAEKHDNVVPLIENELYMLKKCEAKTRKRKSNKYEEGQAEKFQENESCLLKPCKVSSNKRMANQPKQVEDQVDDLFESELEKKEDGLVRKRARNNAPRKKPSNKLMGTFHDLAVESNPSEDELTVEDLVSIAEEYVKADKRDFQKSNREQDTISLHRIDTQIDSGKHLTTNRENSLATDQPLSSDSSLAKPLSGGGHIADSSTIDPNCSMIDLLLGPRWRKKSDEVERKTDSITQKIMLECERIKKSHNDTITEVAPVVKKKISLKDKIRSFLD